MEKTVYYMRGNDPIAIEFLKAIGVDVSLAKEVTVHFPNSAGLIQVDETRMVRKEKDVEGE